jgi:ketosteroid isomerase-like protein
MRSIRDSSMRSLLFALAAATLILPLQVSGQDAAFRAPGTPGPALSATDSAEVLAAVNRFHDLLEAGDSLGVLAMLEPDAVVLESGGFEDRAEYRSHHLQSDIQFARAVRSERSLRSLTVHGAVAWASSTSVAQGEFRGRPVNTAGAELMVLHRTADGWRIAAIHWSSRTRR